MAKWYEKDTKNMMDRITIIKEKRSWISESILMFLMTTIIVLLIAKGI